MIKSLHLKNFGPISDLKCSRLSNLNLIIGKNGTGKTFLLKVLYSVIRSSEDFQRGKEPRKFAEILADRMFWTFEADKLGDIVSKGQSERLEVEVVAEHGKCKFEFTERTTNTVKPDQDFDPRTAMSVFLPAKEVISAQAIILSARREWKMFGFDDTYYDLAEALQKPTLQGNNYPNFSKARKNLEEIIGGKVSFSSDKKVWTFKKGNLEFPIGLTSEGTKKIGVLDTLLGNRRLSPGSVLFIDEPESGLHPSALLKFLDIVVSLAKSGIQVFIATHSYFTIKKLYILAKEMDISIPFISFEDESVIMDDLKDGLPDNPIIQESIDLYKNEIEVSF